MEDLYRVRRGKISIHTFLAEGDVHEQRADALLFQISIHTFLAEGDYITT